jgi:hypothetical protein
MATFTYDGNKNIVQTISTNATGDPEQGAVSPLTSAAFNGVIDPTGAPNSFSTTTDRGAGGKTAAFSVQTTNGSGQVTSVVTNPA